MISSRVYRQGRTIWEIGRQTSPTTKWTIVEKNGASVSLLSDERRASPTSLFIPTAVSEKLLFHSSCPSGFYRSHMTNRLAVNARPRPKPSPIHFSLTAVVDCSLLVTCNGTINRTGKGQCTQEGRRKRRQLTLSDNLLRRPPRFFATEEQKRNSLKIFRNSLTVLSFLVQVFALGVRRV